jgi:hypothetical protein
VALTLATGLLLAATADAAEVTFSDLESPPHRYLERTPADRFTRLTPALESGDLQLDRTSEKAFLRGLLERLEIPASSQLLVFSTTSLQLRFITPENPRALYFNEDTYVGYVPGGRIEIVSLDPDLGGIFHLFDVPKGTTPVRVERSDRCMNCHAREDTGFIPGLVVKSVVPGTTGGSLDSFRRGITGHGVPLSDRFGGWHVTGLDRFTNHWGNLLGVLDDRQLRRVPNPPGSRFRFDRYLTGTSDLLAHLLHEHQAGFVNRAIEATDRTRTHLHNDGEKLTAAQEAELDEQARLLTRYLLFADEVLLPSGGVAGNDDFRADFLRHRRTVNGKSLKDLELKTRLFQNRCSYMIYGTAFAGLPAVMKSKVFAELKRALDESSPAPEFAYLPPAEKRSIRSILKGSLDELPPDW